MPTLLELLESALEEKGETVGDLETIVIGENSWHDGPEIPREVEASELSEYSGDAGYGVENLPAIWAWSDEYVYFKATYDGSEWVDIIPRNPTVEHPGSIGG